MGSHLLKHQAKGLLTDTPQGFNQFQEIMMDEDEVHEGTIDSHEEIIEEIAGIMDTEVDVVDMMDEAEDTIRDSMETGVDKEAKVATIHTIRLTVTAGYASRLAMTICYGANIFQTTFRGATMPKAPHQTFARSAWEQTENHVTIICLQDTRNSSARSP